MHVHLNEKLPHTMTPTSLTLPCYRTIFLVSHAALFPAPAGQVSPSGPAGSTYAYYFDSSYSG